MANLLSQKDCDYLMNNHMNHVTSVPPEMKGIYNRFMQLCNSINNPNEINRIIRRGNKLTTKAKTLVGALFEYFTPIITNDDQDVFYNITLDKDGLWMKIDLKRTNSSGHQGQYMANYLQSHEAQNIEKNTAVLIPKNELDSLSINDLTNKFICYTKENLTSFLLFGIAIGSKSCKNSYDNLPEVITRELVKTNHNLILTGAPGTGKTFLAKSIAVDIIGCGNMDKLKGNDQFGFVQFHPSYDYTDFVEGLRPKQIGNQIGFERQDGIFKAFCAKAAKEFRNAKEEEKEPKPFVFVIDEINRGEISKIFGELFYSIDPGYRGEKGIVDTQYHNLILTDKESKAQDYPFKKGFYVPENVFVIGTMNDIDRSVESMDFAFRRRFVFYEVSAKKTQESILFACPSKDDAIMKMDKLNELIERDGFSPAYHIGASYFQRIKEYNGDFDKLWRLHLRGLLFEYLRGLPDADSILKGWENAYYNA